jgi:hypothetical protein
VTTPAKAEIYFRKPSVLIEPVMRIYNATNCVEAQKAVKKICSVALKLLSQSFSLYYVTFFASWVKNSEQIATKGLFQQWLIHNAGL